MFSGGGEDRFLYERYFGDRKGGVFLDVAGPGATGNSPTETFERIFDWRGACIDAGDNGPAIFGEKRRAGIDVCKDDADGMARLIRSRDFTGIDYCAIRGEGGRRVLDALRRASIAPSVVSLADLSASAAADSILAESGYRLAATLPTGVRIFVDDKIARRPAVTVICAVWSRDPARRVRLAGHRENLDRQIVPVERIYVFEEGDTPPPGLPGRSLVAHHPLTIYEAWNLALAATATPYAMNLNLDDRLCIDAVARMEEALDAGAHIVGGDWRICFSMAETDDVPACYAADALPVARAPVPEPDVLARLGNATGDHKSLGHATMWRMALHREIPRLPTRCGDGTPIRAKGDSLWWQLLNAAGKRLERLPLIIGHYYFHPDEQAEYRYDGGHEIRRARDTGLIVF